MLLRQWWWGYWIRRLARSGPYGVFKLTHKAAFTGSHTKEEWLGVESRLNRAGLQRQEDEKARPMGGGDWTFPGSQAHTSKEQQAASGGVRSHTQLLLERRGRRDVQYPRGQWLHQRPHYLKTSREELRNMRVMNDWHHRNFLKLQKSGDHSGKNVDVKEKVVSEMKSELGGKQRDWRETESKKRTVSGIKRRQKRQKELENKCQMTKGEENWLAV